MKCPVDGAELAAVTRQGISYHRCPACGGVWLAREGLDALIALVPTPPAAPLGPGRPPPRRFEERGTGEGRGRGVRFGGPHSRGPGRPRGLLEEIFAVETAEPDDVDDDEIPPGDEA